MPELMLGRPKDETLRAYKDWVLDTVEAITGERTDDLTPEEWEADWREFWQEAA